MKNTLLSLALFAATASGLRAAEPIPDSQRINGVAIGCQAYTFNRFSAFEAIEKATASGAKVIEFYPGQKSSPAEPETKLDHNASAETLAKVKAKLAEHGLMAVAYEVVGLSKDRPSRARSSNSEDDGHPRHQHQSTDALDTFEKLVKEYDVMVGFHNHPRRENDPNYKVWDPNYILELVKDRDPRIGACADTGHWMRSDLKQIMPGRAERARRQQSPQGPQRLRQGRPRRALRHRRRRPARDPRRAEGAGFLRSCFDRIRTQLGKLVA